MLETKKERFLAYEQATLALLDCAPEDAENYITQRGELATEIDGVNEEIEQICGSVPDGATMLAASKVALPFEQVSSEYQCIFYSGQAVQSVIHRILQSEGQVKERLEKLRNEAMEGIKLNQNMPKIKKYLTDLAEPPAQSFTEGKA